MADKEEQREEDNEETDYKEEEEENGKGKEDCKAGLPVFIHSLTLK